MADNPNEFLAPFVSPLTHDQHARVGRISILWGQVDMILDQLLQIALGITGEQRIALLGDKQVGSKLDLLKNNLHRIKNDEARDLAKQFWDLANQTKPHRNKCFHGVWGYRIGKRKNQIFPAAGHFRSSDDPLRVTQLPALEKKLCKTGRVGLNALVVLHQFSDKVKGCNRMFHGPGDAPAWLSEWTEQHPLDDDALDRRWKRGQLPFLKKPL